MKRTIVILLIVAATLAGLWAAFHFTPRGEWQGADDKLEAIAAKAGREPSKPLIPLEGDAALFAFLLAGVIGGGVAGYFFRGLFDPRLRQQGKPSGAAAPADSSSNPRSDSRA